MVILPELISDKIVFISDFLFIIVPHKQKKMIYSFSNMCMCCCIYIRQGEGISQ